MKRNVMIIIFCLAFGTLAGQTQKEQFHSEILSLYSFQPHKLTGEQINKKSGELEKFWKSVEADKENKLIFLRQELSDYNNPSFFLYDGSKLLLHLSKSSDDKQIALNAVPHCDLADIQPGDYFSTLHSLSIEGFNTTHAALHILSDPEFKVFIPQHALTIDQNYSLIYLLLPVEESLYIDSLKERLLTEKSDAGQKSLLLLLWYTVSDKGDSAISDYIENNSAPKNLRAYANELSEKSKEIKPSFFSFLLSHDIGKLKSDRAGMLVSINAETQYDLEKITRRIRAEFQRKTGSK